MYPVPAVYTGANAQAVESSVTTLLEQSINGVEGMRYMTSSSGNDGSSSINIVFELTRPLDIAAVDVQNRVSAVLGRLPNEVKNTGVTVNKVSTSFIMATGFYSLDNRYDNEFISNYIDIYVKDALKRVHGVSDVQIFGERKYAMRLWLPHGSRRGDLRLRTWFRRYRNRTFRSLPARLGLSPHRPTRCSRSASALWDVLPIQSSSTTSSSSRAVTVRWFGSST